MAESVSFPLRAAGARVGVVARAATIPWYIWCALAAVACSVLGDLWDISWHQSIGRDTFWTPPHLLIYSCGCLAGVGSGALILATTFGRDPALREASVSIVGLRGPLGAFLCAWGGIAMLSSAPLDNWWHNAYGLDVKILSPPHVWLALGIIAIRIGALLLTLAVMNRSAADLRAKLETLTYALLVSLLGLNIGIALEATWRHFMHSARFYLVVAMAVPLWMGVVPRVLRRRWACTIVTGTFTMWRLLLLWLMPLIPAEPKLGPVYFQVTHLIPPDFPLLLIFPAVACDLARPRLAGRSGWTQAVVLGALFLAVFLAVQWPFADFLMSHASRNAFFGTQYLPFFVPPTSDWARNVFSIVEGRAPKFWGRLILAFGASILTMRIGFAWGEWMRRVRR